MDEQKTQTSAQPEHIPLLLIARELWRKLGLILMFAATVAACGYIAATLLYRPVYQTQTTFVVSVRNGSTVYANLNTASSMAETLSTFFEGDVMRKCITNDIGAVSGTIKAKQIPETNLLTMTVSAPTQRDAHRITQSVLRNYNEQANKLLGDVALDVLCRPTVPVAPANSSGAVRIAKLSGLAGLLAAALYLAVRVYLRDTVKCEADVEQKLDTRLLATVRHEKKYKTLRAQLCLRKRKTSILITNPTTGFAFVETFKRLRTRVDYLMRRAQGRTILVTSLLEDEGKSTVAVNLALAMARRLKRAYGDGVEFHVVGSFEEGYKPLMDELEQTGVVKYHGYQSDMKHFYAMADCVVLPSYHEGMSNVLLEAAASGRPLITSDIPGCREAVEPGVSGYLCPARDADALYATMRRFAELPPAQRAAMGAASHDWIARNFDKKAVVAETVAALL